LAKSSQFRQFGTRNLVVVQANGVENIKSIDVANNGWTSCGHSKNENNSLKNENNFFQLCQIYGIRQARTSTTLPGKWQRTKKTRSAFQINT
jgi:hypothetical protein